MTNNALEDFVIEQLLIMNYSEKQIGEIIIHLRNLNLENIFIEFLLAEGDFIWYLLNTFEYMQEHLLAKNINLTTYYSVAHKHPKSNYWVNFCKYPPNYSREERTYYWNVLAREYATLLNTIN